MQQWFVYMLRCRDGSLYTGIALDVPKRVAAHNAGHGAKYTRSHSPVVLVWHEAMASESAARKREMEIKKLKKSEKEFLITKTRS